MTSPLSRISLLWKILLSTSVAITALFALSGWIAVYSATQATTASVRHEAQASFQAYQSLWQSRAARLSSISSVLAAMSDVRAAFRSGDAATIRDTAGELWARVSEENAFFLVTTPRGEVIASLGGDSRLDAAAARQAVRDALPHFPNQVSGFLAPGGKLYHVVLTPVYIETTGGTALLNVLAAGYEVDEGVATRLKQATGGSEFLFAAGGRVIGGALPHADTAVRDLAPASQSVSIDGIEYAPLVTSLNDINGAEVGRLAILRSFEAARHEISKLRRNISLLWLLFMAAGLALTYLPARRIIEPVKELDRAAARVARQEYDCVVPVKSRDELGRLAETFNAMCASIRSAREELIRSERIATVGRLATSIVHDLRNPLATIYGGAEMLMYSQLSEAQVQRLAGNMHKASLRLQELLQDLLDIGSGRSAEAQPCDLRELAEDAGASIAAAAEGRSIKILIQIPPGIEITVNRRRIERVFSNLMGNALDVMPSGGEIRISATKTPESVVVKVQDTGPGIAPEIRNRLFQPFVTAGKRSGLGLGLAFSRQAVVDHGGDMWEDSSEGQGACFSFRLPGSNGDSRG